jgi:O-antigen/teichoic acid export membrane protein
MPFGFCQGQGRPDLVAKIHLCEILPYLLCLIFLMNSYGIVGAALAWSLRATVDFFLLWWFARIPLQRLRLILPSACVVAIALLGAYTLQKMIIFQVVGAFGLVGVILWIWQRSDPSFIKMQQQVFARLRLMRPVAAAAASDKDGL